MHASPTPQEAQKPEPQKPEEDLAELAVEATLGFRIPPDHVVPSLTNPRKRFDIAELTESVKKHGVLQPIVVRPWPASRKAPKDFPDVAAVGFELVAGERRWRAAKAAGLEDIPVIVRKLGDAEVVEIQLVENLQRTDLHPLEEAQGYQQLMTKGKYDVARIAERTGRSVKYVYDRVKLLALTKDAQKVFLEDKFAAGHAIILARLKPEDQKRAMTEGALFQSERLLWDPTELVDDGLKAVSVRELQGWVDEHVRFDTEAPDRMLFPETALAIDKARETKAKVIAITSSYQVHPEARGEGRIFTERSWKRADGHEASKTCPRAVTGVLVAGPGRGQAFDVCVNKDNCDVHWAKEKREKKKTKGKSADATPAPNRYELEEKRRAEVQARWKKATPTILEAVAAKVKKAPAQAGGLLGQILLGGVTPYAGARGPEKLVPRGHSAEDLVRHAAFILLYREANSWNAPIDFPKRAKAFGVDAKKILDEVAPREKPAPKAAKKKAPRKAATKKKTPKKRALKSKPRRK